MSEIKNAKEIAETAKKKEVVKRKLENENKHLQSDILHGRDTSKSALDVKYAKKEYDKLERELERLKK